MENPLEAYAFLTSQKWKINIKIGLEFIIVILSTRTILIIQLLGIALIKKKAKYMDYS